MFLTFLLPVPKKGDGKWRKKPTPFYKKKVDDADFWKTHPFDVFFFGNGCAATLVVSDPRDPPPGGGGGGGGLHKSSSFLLWDVFCKDRTQEIFDNR